MSSITFSACYWRRATDAEGYRDLNDHKLEHPVDAIVRQYTVSVLDQIARRVRNQDRSTASCTKFLDVAGDDIRRASALGGQGNELRRSVLEMMTGNERTLTK